MRDVRRSAVVICVLFAGCSGDAGQPHRESAVTGKVDLDNPRAATTSSAVFTFSGKVSPPDSKVSVSDGTVRVEPSGRFTVAVASPRAGSKQVKLAATNPGRRSWRLNVRVARGQPKRVKVPERDVLAPTAGLLLEPGGGAPPSVQASPSRADDAPDVVTLSEPSFRGDGGGPRRRGRHRPHSPRDGGDHAVRQARSARSSVCGHRPRSSGLPFHRGRGRPSSASARRDFASSPPGRASGRGPRPRAPCPTDSRRSRRHDARSRRRRCPPEGSGRPRPMPTGPYALPRAPTSVVSSYSANWYSGSSWSSGPHQSSCRSP